MQPQSELQAAIDQWRALLGDAHVLVGEAASAAYGTDASGNERRIPAALRVLDHRQVAEIMRIAQRHRTPVYPISTGRNWGYGTALPARDDCVLIDLAALQSILHFDAELGVVTIEPGVTQQILADFLDAGDHPFLVPVTGAGPLGGLMGNALERGYGVTPYVDHFSAVTDIEAVLADGSLYRTALAEAGGEELARLFKWGIGPYSTGLFTQSGFGIVTRMSIVLARRPEAVGICLFSLKSDDLLGPAVERVRAIVGKLPGVVGAVNLMNRHRVLAMSAPYPAGSLGHDGLIPPALIEALGRQYQVMPWTGFCTLYGTARVVAAAKRDIKAQLAGVASRVLFIGTRGADLLGTAARLVPGAVGEKLSSTAATLANALQLVAGRPNETALPLAYWRHPNPPLATDRDPSRDGCGLIWYAPLVPMRADAVVKYVEFVKQVTSAHRMEPLITLTTQTDRLFDSTIPLLFDRQQPAEAAAASACHDELLRRGRELGVFPYRVGIHAMENLLSWQPQAQGFHRRLRRELDPGDILAPGRYM